MHGSSPFRTRRLGVVAAAVVAAVAPIALAPSPGQAAPRAVSVPASDWTTFDHDPLRTGVDPSGASFSPARPAWTSPTLDG